MESRRSAAYFEGDGFSSSSSARRGFPDSPPPPSSSSSDACRRHRLRPPRPPCIALKSADGSRRQEALVLGNVGGDSHVDLVDTDRLWGEDIAKNSWCEFLVN